MACHVTVENEDPWLSALSLSLCLSVCLSLSLSLSLSLFLSLSLSLCLFLSLSLSLSLSLQLYLSLSLSLLHTPGRHRHRYRHTLLYMYTHTLVLAIRIRLALSFHCGKHTHTHTHDCVHANIFSSLSLSLSLSRNPFRFSPVMHASSYTQWPFVWIILDFSLSLSPWSSFSCPLFSLHLSSTHARMFVFSLNPANTDCLFFNPSVKKKKKNRIFSPVNRLLDTWGRILMKSELKLTEVCVTLDLHVAACANVLLGMFFISCTIDFTV